MIFLRTPICGAASPTPSAEYIVSNMSFTRARIDSFTSPTGEAFFFRIGSGQIRISRTMLFSIIAGRPGGKRAFATQASRSRDFSPDAPGSWHRAAASRHPAARQLYAKNLVHLG